MVLQVRMPDAVFLQFLGLLTDAIWALLSHPMSSVQLKRQYYHFWEMDSEFRPVLSTITT